jgi:hypothetical protein
MPSVMASACLDHGEGAHFWIGSKYEAGFAVHNVRMMVVSRGASIANVTSEP